MKVIVLVGCCAEKLSRIAPARQLYRSALFKKAAAWAGSNGDEWRVISARYGLIKSDDNLAPYDHSMASMTAAQRLTWDCRVIAQIDAEFDPGEVRFTLLAGESYAGWVSLCDRPVEQPLRGMAIGLRLQWLTDQMQGVAA